MFSAIKREIVSLLCGDCSKSFPICTSILMELSHHLKKDKEIKVPNPVVILKQCERELFYSSQNEISKFDRQ